MHACGSERLGPRIACVLTVALVLRVIWGLAIPVIPLSDSHAYDVFAQNVALGYGYGWTPGHLTAYWPPGTSAIYALCFKVFGHQYMPIVLLQAVVGVGIVALSIALARRWFSDATAITTGWLVSCWPLLIQYTTILASELFFVFFFLLAFWFASMPGRTLLGRGALGGLALAAASYVRPIALVMAPLLYLENLFNNRQRFAAGQACVVTVLVMSVCILPWTIRNWSVFHRFVVVSTNGGTNLWMGNNPESTGRYMSEPKLDISNEVDRDRYLGRLAIQYIVQHPVTFLVRMTKKAFGLYDRQSIGVVWNEEGIVKRLGRGFVLPLKLGSSVYWWLVLAAGIYGIFMFAIRFGLRKLVLSPPFATLVYFTLVYSVTVTGDRYGVSSIPFVAMFSAYAWGHMRTEFLKTPVS